MAARVASPGEVTTRQRGAEAERIAARFLEAQGYEVVALNYRAPHGEIDIIAREQGTLCFVEVRSRSSTDFGDPVETIDAKKQRRLIHAARDYLRNVRSSSWDEMRFDVVGIVMSDPPEIELIRDAFEA